MPLKQLSFPDPDAIIAELDALLSETTGEGEASDAPASPSLLNPRQPADLEPRRTPDAIRPKSVLVIDDSKDYRDLVKHLLTENGFVVATAADGREGVRTAAAMLPDLVLVDFNMPELNGYEVIQEIRGHFETRSIPIVMFTGSANRRHLKTLGMQVTDFLEKPVPNACLLASVRKALALVEAPDSPPAETPTAPAELPVPADESLGDDADLLVDVAAEKKDDDPAVEVIANDSPLVSRVNKILVRAVEMGASDIHIEPQDNEIAVRVRVNGSLQRLCALPEALKSRLAARIKIMAGLVITERRRPQDGQFRAHIKGSKVEFRVSCLPSIQGEKIVLRVLGGAKIKSSLEELGLGERDLGVIRQALQSPHGLILVTGPTGSGKTTTLYTMVRSVAKPDVNVLTAEDPVEYEMPGITQVHVKPAIGLTFESVLRSFLRQDPDVMLVGEVRDLETAEIAVKASIAGHLVFSTLHTNSAPTTITRLAHMGLAPYLLAASVKLVVAQRLIKVLCPLCKLEVPLSEAERTLFNEQENARLRTVFRGVGCRNCRQSGYSGRKPLFEVMPIRTPALRELIIGGASADNVQALAASEGMATLRQAAIDCLADGSTSLGEAAKLIVAD